MDRPRPVKREQLLLSEQRRNQRAGEQTLKSLHWQDRAACLSEDPELFFPVGTTGPALQQIEEAKMVCRTCPVMDSCLKWALDNDQDVGVWGGMSEDERQVLKRRQARARQAK